jgi:hypothetical protein
MREILGPGYSDDDLRRLHRETATALEIAIRTGMFAAGPYEASPYGADWRVVPEEG